MKIQFGLLILVCLGTCIKGDAKDYTEEDVEEFRNFVAQSVFKLVASSLRGYHGPIVQDPSLKATIIPPIDDPITADPLSICGLDITIPVLNISVQGDLNVWKPVVTGLSKFYNDLKVQYIAITAALTIDLDIQLPEVNLVSPYMAEIMFSDDGPGSLDMTGDGILPCGVTDVFLKFHAKGKLPTLAPNLTLSLDELEVDLGFKNLKLDPSGLTSQGDPINLTSLANNVQTLFDSLWTEPTKIAVNEIIRCLIDDLVSECSLSTLIVDESINLGCLKDTINEECLPSEESSFKQGYVFETPVCLSGTFPTEEPTEEPPTDPTEAPPTDPTAAPPTDPTAAPPTDPTATPPTDPTATPPNASTFLALSPVIIAVVTAISFGNFVV